MKTIFIPIQNRQQARNVLRTDIFNFLISFSDIRIIFFAPDYMVDEYKKEFKNKKVIFEGMKEPLKYISKIDAFFGRLSLFYIDSPTGRFLRKQWLFLEKRQPIRYIFSFFLSLLMGNIKILRLIARFFDFKFVKDNSVSEFFTRYKPNLVYSPNIISDIDRSFLREAKKKGIKTVGMINAWDNITLAKYPFRILPQKLIVYNEIIKKEAVKYLDIKEKDIFMSGWPHFDHYINSKRISRMEFCKKLGIDPKKRIILFASIGSTLNPTEWQVLDMLDKSITDKKLPDNIMIIFRQHPTEKTKMENIKISRNIVIDDSKTIISSKNKTYSEILKSDMNHLADSIFHSDVTIHTCSTMSIDAAAFDKPIINIAFDGDEKKPFYQSVKRFYEPSHAHYQSIVKSEGVRIAYNMEELIRYISMYLKNPFLDKDGRKRIVDEQCYKLDGQSGKRIGEAIYSFVFTNYRK